MLEEGQNVLLGESRVENLSLYLVRFEAFQEYFETIMSLAWQASVLILDISVSLMVPTTLCIC